jgi:DNA polymerase I
MQANGAEMLGLACCFAVDRNIPIIAPIHDALLIEGPATDIEDIAREMKRCMIEASRAVLGGPAVRVDTSKPLIFPDRYVDGRDGSVELWETTIRLLAQLKRKTA